MKISLIKETTRVTQSSEATKETMGTLKRTLISLVKERRMLMRLLATTVSSGMEAKGIRKLTLTFLEADQLKKMMVTTISFHLQVVEPNARMKIHSVSFNLFVSL